LEQLLQEAKLIIWGSSAWQKLTQETVAEVYKITTGTDKTKSQQCIWYFSAHGTKETIRQQFRSKQKEELSQSYIFAV